MDFEEALSNAWLEVFPESSILRDLFHFMQANKRKVKEFKLKHYKEDIKVGLQRIWHADSKPEFDLRQDEFLHKWTELAPEFADYYERVWMKLYPSTEWASYARPADAPSGTLRWCINKHNLMFMLQAAGLWKGSIIGCKTM